MYLYPYAKVLCKKLERKVGGDSVFDFYLFIHEKWIASLSGKSMSYKITTKHSPAIQIDFWKLLGNVFCANVSNQEHYTYKAFPTKLTHQPNDLG